MVIITFDEAAIVKFEIRLLGVDYLGLYSLRDVLILGTDRYSFAIVELMI